MEHVRGKHFKLKYYKGPESINDTPKKYQISPIKSMCQRKPGPLRGILLEDEILLTLMHIQI